MYRSTLAALLALSVAGCHTTNQYQDTTTSADSVLAGNPGEPRALSMELSVTEAGMFRFREPLVCRDDLLVEQYTWDVKKKEPNVATAIIGIIVTAGSAIAAISGASDDQAALTYAGIAGVGVGLTFAIGPFFGNTSSRDLVSEKEVKKNSEIVPCGDRPVRAWSATLTHAKLKIPGTVDDDGVFSVSPFTFVDAFAVGKLPGLDIAATLLSDDGKESRIETVMSAEKLAAGRDGFLAANGIDGTVGRLLKVPNVTGRDLRVTRTTIDGKLPAARIEVTIDNAGPGDAWAVRGRISSTHPGIDGRFIYVGHLAAKDSKAASIELQMPPHGDDISDAQISIILYDAHDTTREHSLDFTGPVLNEAF
jgi:hypothetical protein